MAVRLNRLIGAALLLWPVLLAAQTQSQMAAILERLDRLERENQALAEEVRTLRARIDGTPGAADRSAPEQPVQPATVEQQVQVQGRRIEEQEQTKVEASQRFPLRITGFALFNAFSNSRQSGGFEYPAVASEPGARTAGGTIRQTVFGLDYRGPTTLWGGRVHGSLFMDLLGGTGFFGELRVRTASIEIDWKNRSFTVGQDKPIFNPREPSSLAQVGISPLTGAGNLWLWLPQARFEQDLSFTQSTGLRARVGVVQTREFGPYPGSPTVATPEAARPGLEGRFEFYHNLDDERRIEIAPGFHTSQTHVLGQSVGSRVFSMDWFLNPWRRVELTGAFYTGQNVTPLGAGYNQGYGIYYGMAEAVGSQGGWAQLTIHTLPRLDLHFFSGQQDDNNEDLRAGRISKNLLYGGNLYYRLAPNVLLALEATQLRTSYIAQGLRINNHYDLALAYFF